MDYRDCSHPTCGCERFFLKDPDDEYEIYAFTTKKGNVTFDPDLDSSNLPEITNESEAFCDKCSWHGKLEIS